MPLCHFASSIGHVQLIAVCRSSGRLAYSYACHKMPENNPEHQSYAFTRLRLPSSFIVRGITLLLEALVLFFRSLFAHSTANLSCGKPEGQYMSVHIFLSLIEFSNVFPLMGVKESIKAPFFTDAVYFFRTANLEPHVPAGERSSYPPS